VEASNSGFIADAADGRFEDWFEIYSPETADLRGYYITDNLTNQFKFKIPSGYTISPAAICSSGPTTTRTKTRTPDWICT
jgi:hypothetical protein